MLFLKTGHLIGRPLESFAIFVYFPKKNLLNNFNNFNLSPLHNLKIYIFLILQFVFNNKKLYLSYSFFKVLFIKKHTL
jgi:hypothetical protein